MSDNQDVTVLGAAAVDLVAQVNRLPEVDEMVFAREYDRFTGGSGANIAVGLAKLGREVIFLGKLGDDGSGKWLLENLTLAGVNTQSIQIVEGGKSASCFVALDPKGDRVIFALGGTALIGNVEGLDFSTITGSRVLCICDAYIAVAEAAAKAARQSGTTVFFIPGGLMVSFELDKLRPILKNTNILVVSKSEADMLVGDNPPQKAAQLLQETGPEVAVVTLGAKGAVLASKDNNEVVPSFNMKIRDTTGAGDAFTAGLIHAFLKGRDWRKAVRTGNAVAAMKIKHLGASSGLPHRAELKTFMKTRGV